MHLSLPPAHWDQTARAAALERRDDVIVDLVREYGSSHLDQKVDNFRDVGPFPQSILGYHNEFLAQIRRAFVIGAYYPALTGAVSLGERILNHVVIALSSSFTKSRKYHKARAIAVQGGDDNWAKLIAILQEWNVLLDREAYDNTEYPSVAGQFLKLRELRNRAVHYHGGAIEDDIRGAAIESIELVQSIILRQFGFFTYQPWFMRNTPGAQFIRRQYESDAFVMHYYPPNCLYVGPYYKIEFRNGQGTVIDNYPYEQEDISDDEFAELWLSARK